MTRLTDLCKCLHEYGLHSKSRAFCLAARCGCQKFIPYRETAFTQPPRQTLELHQQPTDDEDTEK